MLAFENRVLPISDVPFCMKMLNVRHLAGICRRLGGKTRWDLSKERTIGDELAATMMRRRFREGFEIDLG